MKSLTRYFQGLMLGALLITTISCEDFALGEKFLQKPPSSVLPLYHLFYSGICASGCCGIVTDICHMILGK